MCVHASASALDRTPVDMASFDRVAVARSVRDIDHSSAEANTPHSVPSPISSPEHSSAIQDGADQQLSQVTPSEAISPAIVIPDEQNSEASTKYSSLAQGYIREFTPDEVKAATEEFSDKVGKGGFGTVFRGTFKHLPVAVKVLNAAQHSCTGLTVAATLQHEVEVLTRFRHPNVIQLMGYCTSPPSFIMPYMEQLSLHHHLHQYKMETPLSWSQRTTILKGTARGLAYLHSSRPPFVHRDVKSANILLDRVLNAVLADFGFVAAMPVAVGSTTVVTATASSMLVWSRGYQAPEVADGKHGTPIDVYSYGVVVLETFTGLLAYNDDREEVKLVDHCEDALTVSSLENFRLIADRKAGTLVQQVASLFKEIILATTQKRHKRRESMDEIVRRWDSEQ